MFCVRPCNIGEEALASTVAWGKDLEQILSQYLAPLPSRSLTCLGVDERHSVGAYVLRGPNSSLGLVDAAPVDFVHLASFVVIPELVEDGGDDDSSDVDLDQLQNEYPVAPQVDGSEFPVWTMDKRDVKVDFLFGQRQERCESRFPVWTRTRGM